jgi:hypothetical protein
MYIRPFKDKDSDAIFAMHEASGFDYPMPDLRSPLMCVLGVADSDGVPVAVAGIKLIGEAYLWMDATMSDRTKAKALLKLHRDMKLNAKQIGLDQVVCHLPPEIDSGFSTRLLKFGWNKSVWSGYAINV